MKIAGLSQEHAEAVVSASALYARFPVGASLRIIPNHSCLAAACFERYLVLRGGEVVDEMADRTGVVKEVRSE